MQKEGKWFKEDREPFIKGSLNLFKVSDKRSVRSQASINRESDINTLMNRVSNQLYTYFEQNLPWRTPEDWDSSLDIIKGGQSCRRSKSILSRISWEKFLIRCDQLLEEYKTK